MTRLRGCFGFVALLTGCSVGNVVADVDDVEQHDALALARAEQDLIDALARPDTSDSTLHLAYSQYLSIAPEGPERALRGADYAALLIAEGRLDEAARRLSPAVDMPQLDVRVRARAARQLLDVRVQLWKATSVPTARIDAALRVRELLLGLRGDADIWSVRGEDGAALRRHDPALLVELGWDLAVHHRLRGIETGSREAFGACVDELLGLYNGYLEFIEPGAVLADAADCATRSYQINVALSLRRELVGLHPGAPQAVDALFALAETYQRVLFYREAIEFYHAFVQDHGDDERADLARARWLQLAVTLGDPLADVIATWRDDSLDEQELAAAVAFRAAQQTDDAAAMAAYLSEHRKAGGPARELAARIALATDALARSCPDSREAIGLCTRQTIDGRLGEVLYRDRAEQRRAVRELALAQQLIADPTWTDDPVAVAGRPLALGEHELRSLQATVALLVGDLSAEEALGVQPPRTYEASRTRIWLDERKRSVAAMISAYERVGVSDAAQAAAAAERSAQVYESDATLLGRVALELRERREPELAAELEQLEAERLSQALASYQHCLATIAAYGADPADVQHACRLGVGRVCGRSEIEVAWTEPSSLRTLVLGAN